MVKNTEMNKLALAILFVMAVAVQATTITKNDIIKTIEHQRQLVHQAQDQATAAKNELAVVQDAVNTQTAKLHDTENKLNVATKELSTAKHHLHMLLLICSGLVGFIAFAGVLRFSSTLLAFSPPALAEAWLISVGAGFIAGGAAWSLLGHL